MTFTKRADIGTVRDIFKRTMNKLVLFDIDGTLMDAGEAGARSMKRSFYELFSIKDAFAAIEMAGKTDIQIIKEGLLVHGLPSEDGGLGVILSRYIDILKIEINNKRKHLNPGVVDLLNTLTAMDGCWVGLLTGNIERGARIKLDAFGLNDYFSVGAFGSDSEDRNALLPIAVRKFRRKTKIALRYSDCIVIGDTPSDVQCSKPFGAISVAVATGPYSYESLLETGADYVLRTLYNAIDSIAELRKAGK